MRSMGSGLSISAERMRTAVRFEASLRRAEKDGDEVAVNPTLSDIFNINGLCCSIRSSGNTSGNKSIAVA